MPGPRGRATSATTAKVSCAERAAFDKYANNAKTGRQVCKLFNAEIIMDAKLAG